MQNDQFPGPNPGFKAEHIEKTARIVLGGPATRVFPLFGAYEERKWTKGWDPIPVFPAEEIIREGTTFQTPGHGHGEDHYTWIVDRYLPDRLLIQYLVYTGNRHWTITIACTPLPGSQTSATITYAFTGHNTLGNDIDRRQLDKLYAFDLKDWEKDINDYLGKK